MSSTIFSPVIFTVATSQLDNANQTTEADFVRVTQPTVKMNHTVEAEFMAVAQPRVVTVIFVLIGIVGTCGNVLVSVVMASTLRRGRSSTTNLLILNQALVDSLTSFILILIYTLPDPYIPAAGGGWAEFLCRMWVSSTLLWMLFVVSTFNLCMMSLERYFAVSHPVLYSTRFSKRTALIMILFSWIVAPLLHYYYPIAYDYSDGGECKKRGNPAVVATIGVMIFVWEFFIPFLIMAVVYTRIVYILRRQQRRVKAVTSDASVTQHHIRVINDMSATHHNASATPRAVGNDRGMPHLVVINAPSEGKQSTSGSSSEGHHPPNPTPHHSVRTTRSTTRREATAPSETVRRNVTVTLLSVFVMYVICWMPNHLTFLQFGLGGPLNLAGAWYYITLVLAYLNMCINPFIYALKYRAFKEGFRKLFCRWATRPGREDTNRSAVYPRSTAMPDHNDTVS